MSYSRTEYLSTYKRRSVYSFGMTKMTSHGADIHSCNVPAHGAVVIEQVVAVIDAVNGVTDVLILSVDFVDLDLDLEFGI